MVEGIDQDDNGRGIANHELRLIEQEQAQCTANQSDFHRNRLAVTLDRSHVLPQSRSGLVYAYRSRGIKASANSRPTCTGEGERIDVLRVSNYSQNESMGATSRAGSTHVFWTLCRSSLSACCTALSVGAKVVFLFLNIAPCAVSSAAIQVR